MERRHKKVFKTLHLLKPYQFVIHDPFFCTKLQLFLEICIIKMLILYWLLYFIMFMTLNTVQSTNMALYLGLKMLITGMRKYYCRVS